MKKNKYLELIIPFCVFNSKVYCFINYDNTQIDNIIDRLFKDKIINSGNKQYLLSTLKENDFAGIAIHFPDSNDFIFIPKDNKLSLEKIKLTFIHEANHVTFYVLNNRNNIPLVKQTKEIYALTEEYIIKEFFKQLKSK